MLAGDMLSPQNGPLLTAMRNLNPFLKFSKFMSCNLCINRLPSSFWVTVYNALHWWYYEHPEHTGRSRNKTGCKSSNSGNRLVSRIRDRKQWPRPCDINRKWQASTVKGISWAPTNVFSTKFFPRIFFYNVCTCVNNLKCVDDLEKEQK